MSDRAIGIPPDHVYHKDIRFSVADDPPYMWHRQGRLMQIAKMLESGNQLLKIGIIDTGHAKHKWLPEATDVFNFTNESTAEAGDPHGVHVWGIIGGLKGIGLLPFARFYIFKGLDSNGSGATSWLNGAIRKAADIGCHFVNGSYGSNQGSQDDIDACKYFYTVGRKNGGGLLLHFAAGNAGYNGKTNTIGWPAMTGLCSVNGSYDATGERSSFSSGGPKLQVLGAGGKIVSTVTGNDMGVMSGTSMGSPDVCAKSGLISLARQAAGLPPLVGPDEWDTEYKRLFQKKLIKDGGEPGRDNYHGYGQFMEEALIEHVSELAGLGV